MQDVLTTTQQEVSRLAQNSKMLFDLFPDMLLIIKDDFVIERMNAAAVNKLGKQQGLKCYQRSWDAKPPVTPTCARSPV